MDSKIPSNEFRPIFPAMTGGRENPVEISSPGSLDGISVIPVPSKDQLPLRSAFKGARNRDGATPDTAAPAPSLHWASDVKDVTNTRRKKPQRPEMEALKSLVTAARKNGSLYEEKRLAAIHEGNPALVFACKAVVTAS